MRAELGWTAFERHIAHLQAAAVMEQRSMRHDQITIADATLDAIHDLAAAFASGGGGAGQGGANAKARAQKVSPCMPLPRLCPVLPCPALPSPPSPQQLDGVPCSSVRLAITLS